MLCITRNSIEHQLFVYTQLNFQSVLFQTIQFSIDTQFFVYTQLNVKIVLFQAIQFSISTQFKCQTSILPIDRNLSSAITPSLIGPGSEGNEGVLCIPQNSCITRASLLDYLMSYQDIRWGSFTLLQSFSQLASI